MLKSAGSCNEVGVERWLHLATDRMRLPDAPRMLTQVWVLMEALVFIPRDWVSGSAAYSTPLASIIYYLDLRF